MAEFGADGKSTIIEHSAPQVPPDPTIQLTPPDDDVVDVETDDSVSDPNAAAIADLANDHAERPDIEPGRVIKGEVVDDSAPLDVETSTAVALQKTFDVATTGEVWKHDFLTFQGDRLGIRVPTRQALAAFSLATGKYVDVGVKNDITGLFIARHLSPESYGRVFSRLMEPDDDAYTVDTVGELFNAIVTTSLQPTDDEKDKPR